jgi:hypothetical protein
MNVASSTSTASTASTSDVSSTQTQAKTNSNSKTSEKSFDEEMQNVSKSEEAKDTNKAAASENKKETNKTSNNDKTNSKLEEEDNNTFSQNFSDDLISSELLAGNINFTDYKYNTESQTLLSQNIQNLLNTKDLMTTVNSATTVDYDAINMSDSDATFFANLVQNTNMSMQDIAAQVSENQNAQTAQSVQVSSVLMEKLADSMKTNQSFRINFDKDVSVIIKVNKDGSLMANFIPGDKAVEQYLKENIASLRQRFDDENLAYSELSYSNSREQQQQQQRRKKENSNE